MPVSECTVPWRPGFCVGLGVSFFSGEAAVRPWAFPDAARPQLNSATHEEAVQPRTVQFEEKVVDRNDQYEKTLEAAASLNIKGWGIVSPQGSLDFLCNMQLDSRTQHYVVIARFVTGTYNVLATSTYQPGLSQYAATELQSKGPKWWAEQYGTHFIAGYIVGGHMIGVASITSQTSRQALEVKANLQAKFGHGWLGTAKGNLSGNSDNSMTGCEVNTKYHYAGATALDVDTSDIFALRKAARLHMQEGAGLKCLAILWPFAHLEGYNNAAALYQGPPELPAWQHDPVAIIRMLNLEFAKLQRLKNSIAACSSLEHQNQYQTMSFLVQGALKALYKIQSCADLFKVAEHHPDFDQELHREIFAADQVECMLLEQQQRIADTHEAYGVNGLQQGQVPALTALLQSSHAEQAASELLRLTQGSQEDRKAVIAAGALPAVVSLLASAQIVVQQRSAAALGALAADSLQVRDTIGGAGALPLLIHLLSSAQPTVQEHAAAALAALLDNSQQNRDASIAAYALLPLLKILGSGHIAAQEHAASALYHLSCGNQQNRDAIAAAGALPPLLSFVTGDLYSVVSGYQYAASMAASNVALGSQQGRDAMVAAGGVLQILHLLKSPDSDVQRWAAKVLVALALTEESKSLIRAEVMPVLASLLKSGNTAVQDLAAQLFFHVANHAEENDRALIAAGIPSALVSILEERPNADAPANTLTQLANCGDEEYQDAIIAGGALPVFVAWLRTDQPDAQCRAATILHFLSVNASCREAIVTSQVLPALVSCLGSTDSEARRAAAQALGHLADGEVVSNLIMGEKPLPFLLHMLKADECHERQHAAEALDRLAATSSRAYTEISRARRAVHPTRPSGFYGQVFKCVKQVLS